MISIKNLHKSFKGIKILNGLNLEVLPGETLVILGRSGGGKSVLLKQIIGILKPEEGLIEIGGVPISDLEGPALYDAVLHMGMLFQGAALFDSMSVENNVAFFLKEHKSLTDEEIASEVARALEMVGLAGTEKKMPSDLSGGMKKRAALARLIVYSPSIILYDEPTTGLDPMTAMQINSLIVKTQKKLKATSIVVTHDILSALYVADRIALLEDGKIIYIDVPEKFMQINHPVIDFLKKTVPTGNIREIA
jgi:phospholipid/cholesterol/gamma-HCH transport system ATP-binding protein